jgi:hypothetical protein
LFDRLAVCAFERAFKLDDFSLFGSGGSVFSFFVLLLAKPNVTASRLMMKTHANRCARAWGAVTRIIIGRHQIRENA